MKLIFALWATIATGALANAATCVSGNSLQSYITLGAGGCSVGNAQFSLFVDLGAPQTNAIAILPSNIAVNTGGTFLQPSLTFAVNRTAQANTLLESFFRFKVNSTLVGAALSILGSATGTGDANAVANICPGGMFASSNMDGCPMAETLIASTFSDLSDSRSFAKTSFLDVFMDLTVDGGPAGTATLNSATFGVTTIPEPATNMLLLTGMVAIALIRRAK